MIFRPARDAGGKDPYLAWKLASFVLGAALGLLGMATENTILLVAGVVALFVGVMLRFGRRDEDAG